ncbi:hypothetical protein [Gordonia bronchialis]|uniref:hypothetical protein n=1 Tax=Gordonia bronchialis TaxID=2054 RepID=UPI0024326F4F|nr:hypothetical protein [Gordonia bronchialis]
MATDTTSLTEKTTETAATGESSASAPRGKRSPARTAPVARRRTSRTSPAKDTGSSSAAATDSDDDTPDTVEDTTIRRPRRLLAVVAGLLLAGLIGATAFLGYHYVTDDATTVPDAQSSAQAIGVAKDYAIKLSSFDYRDLNKNREAIAAMSTPAFAAKYSQMVTDLTQIVTDGKGEATATVSHAAAEQINGSDAAVMLFVDQQARNVVAPTGKTQAYRMLVKLKNIDGRWLVDDVQTL